MPKDNDKVILMASKEIPRYILWDFLFFIIFFFFKKKIFFFILLKLFFMVLFLILYQNPVFDLTYYSKLGYVRRANAYSDTLISLVYSVTNPL